MPIIDGAKFFNPPSEQWCRWVVNYIVHLIEDVHSKKKTCNILLTGGETAKSCYEEWAKSVFHLDNVNFFMGDERFVPLEHEESNSGMVQRTLFKNGISSKSNFYPITPEIFENGELLSQYSMSILRPDIILLGVGWDGHVASIFPENFNLVPEKSGYTVVESLKHKYKRVTISQDIIINCHRVILLARNKLDIFRLINLNDESSLINLPAIIVKDKIWIV